MTVLQDVAEGGMEEDVKILAVADVAKQVHLYIHPYNVIVYTVYMYMCICMYVCIICTSQILKESE